MPCVTGLPPLRPSSTGLTKCKRHGISSRVAVEDCVSGRSVIIVFQTSRCRPVRRYLVSAALSLLVAPAMAEPAAEAGQSQSPLPEWLEAVRAQREGLQQLPRREGQRDWAARSEAARQRQVERRADWERQRKKRRALIDLERELFRNYGPWLEPLAPGGLTDGRTPPAPADDDSDRVDVQPPHRHRQPPGWDNRWYYRGW